ncbi:MAG: cache domain-containing protein [Bryobacteraceae bacterium]|nr:cache domain-containing protein [Bryobacteraceae bacterium]
MPADSFELRISFRRLLIGLLVTVVPICLVALYALTKSDRELQRTIGSHFKVVAESTAREISQFIHDRVVQVGTLAAAPTITDVVTSANRSYQGQSQEAIAARIRKIEEGWNTPAAVPLVTQILSTPAAVHMRRFIELDPRFLRITVTDEQGATIAATHKTLDYFQADEDFWQNIYANGRGGINVTDILYDEVSKASYIGIGVPVTELGTNRFIGTLDALVDVSSLFSVVNQAHPPLNLRTTLVKEDGTVISAPEANLAMNLKSQEFIAVQDALTTIQGRQTGNLVTEVPNSGRRVIAYADTGLRDDYRNLGWIVLVSADAREAFASIRTVGRLTAFLAAVGLTMVTLLAVYFSLHRKRPYGVMQEVAEESAQSRTATA